MAILGMIVIVAAALCGVACLLIGLRGRIVSPHPHCRKCRFDLIGQVTTNRDWAGKVCPECGADLSRPGAVRAGLLLRRAFPFWTGAALLIIAGIATGLLIWGRQQGKGLYSRLPTWIVLRVMDHVQGDELDLIGLEFRARAKAGDLSAAQTASVVEACLRAQADMRRAWAPQCGMFVEEQRTLGTVPATLWYRYLDHAMVLDCNVRPTIVSGDVLPMELLMRDRGGGTGAVETHIRLIDVLIDGRRIDGERQGISVTPAGLGAAPGAPLEPVAMLPQVQEVEAAYSFGAPWVDARVEAPPGRHTVETVWGIVSGDNSRPGVFSGASTTRLHTQPPDGSSPRRSDAEILKQMRVEWVDQTWYDPVSAGVLITQAAADRAAAALLATKVVRLSTSIEVVVRGSESVAPDTTVQQHPPLLKARRELQTWRTPYPPIGPPAPTESFLLIADGTCAIAADLIELREGGEVTVGTFSLEPRGSPGMNSVTSFSLNIPRVPEPPGGRTFVLRPSEAAARRLVHPTPVLRTTVRFQSIPEPEFQPLGGPWSPPKDVVGVADIPGRSSSP